MCERMYTHTQLVLPVNARAKEELSGLAGQTEADIPGSVACGQWCVLFFAFSRVIASLSVTVHRVLCVWYYIWCARRHIHILRHN